MSAAAEEKDYLQCLFIEPDYDEYLGWRRRKFELDEKRCCIFIINSFINVNILAQERFILLLE